MRCRIFGHKFNYRNMLSNGNNFCERCGVTLWDLTPTNYREADK